jgi:hypothetical protein
MSDSAYNDELIGAYLDGELSDRERQRVEQMLAEHAHCRRTLQELRALRENLKSLPSHALGPDFQRRILSEIDRGKQATPAGFSRDKASDTSPASSVQGTMVAKPAVNWRGRAWAVAALAAAVLIMAFVPRHLRDLSVVRGPGHRFDQRDESDRLREEKLVEAPEGTWPAPQDPLVTAHEALGAKAAGGTADRVQGGAGPSTGSLAESASDKPGAAGLDSSGPSSSFSPIIASAMRATDSDLLIHVQVAEATTSGEAFDRSLGQNRIYYAASPADGERAPDEANAPGAITEFDAGLRDNVGKASADARTALPVAPSPAEPLELVYVEATAAQVHATLDELKTQRSQFPQVDLYQVAGWGLTRANQPTPPANAATAPTADGLGQLNARTSVPSQREQAAFFSQELQRQGVPVQVIDDIYEAVAPVAEPAVDGSDKLPAVASKDQDETELARQRGGEAEKKKLDAADEVPWQAIRERSLGRLDAQAYRYAPSDRDQASGGQLLPGVARRLELGDVLTQTRVNPLREQAGARLRQLAEAAPESEPNRAEVGEVRLQVPSVRPTDQAGRDVTSAATQTAQSGDGQRQLRVLFVLSPQSTATAGELLETKPDTSPGQSTQP